jgi:hypothetical protein
VRLSEPRRFAVTTCRKKCLTNANGPQKRQPGFSLKINA